MVLAVHLPKRVAIKNNRLAILHWFSVVSLFVGLVLWKFVLGYDWALEVQIKSQLKIAWDMGNSILAMEQYFTNSPDAVDECVQSGSRRRWGHDFDVVGSCTNMCILDDVLTHSQWSSPAASPGEASSMVCWTDFKRYGLNQRYTALQFLESAGPNDLSLITAKNDWMIDHETQTKANYVEVVPQGRDATIKFTYSFERSHFAPWVFWNAQHTVGKLGTNQDAYTLILDGHRQPVEDALPPGQPIDIAVKDAWKLAARFDGNEGTELLVDALAEGAEIQAKVDCFGTDDEVEEYLGEDAYRRISNLRATFHQPVCLLQFTMTSERLQIHVNYGAATDEQTNYATEVVSETTGIRFKAGVGQGGARVPSFSVILLNVTSILVLLSIPQLMTSHIATKAFGPLSTIYKRVVIEPFDVVQQAAATATVVAANSNTFSRLSTKSPNGGDVLTLSSLKALMDKSFEARRDAIDDKEVMALTAFCYEAMASNEITQHSRRAGFLSLFGVDFYKDAAEGSQSGAASEEVTGKMSNAFRAMEENQQVQGGVTLDQYNQTRLESERLTFDSIVDLFNKDRARSRLEVFFTPPKIKNALRKAMVVQERMIDEGRGMLSASQPPAQVAGNTAPFGPKVSADMGKLLSMTESRLSGSSCRTPDKPRPVNGIFPSSPRAQHRKSGQDSEADIPGFSVIGSSMNDVDMRLAVEEASPRAHEEDDAKSVVQRLAEAKAATFAELHGDMEKLFARLKAAEEQQHAKFSTCSTQDMVSPPFITITEMGTRLAKVESVIAKMDPAIVQGPATVPSPAAHTKPRSSGRDWATAIVESFGSALLSPIEQQRRRGTNSSSFGLGSTAPSV